MNQHYFYLTYTPTFGLDSSHRFSSLHRIFPQPDEVRLTQNYTLVNFIIRMVQVDQNPFYYAAVGGIILGIATSLNYCLRGKVTGMSGSLYLVFSLNKNEAPQKLSIIGGMLLVSGIFFDIFEYGSYHNFTPFGPVAQITTSTSLLGYGLAGLLTGFGAKMANGCTSGHGLCGIPRLSKRSIVSVMIFLSCAIGISTIRYYLSLGPFSDEHLSLDLTYNHQVSADVCIGIGFLLPFVGGYLKKSQSQTGPKEIFADQLITFLTGILFGLGLLVSGMVRRSNIIGFLGLGQNWNPSLLFVLGCGVLVNLVTFNYMLRIKKKSFLGKELFNYQSSRIDWKLAVGSVCFGLGWGIAGLCPGPGIMHLAIFTLPVAVIWLLALVVGMFLQRLLQKCLSESNNNELSQAIKVQSQIEGEPKLERQGVQAIRRSQNLAVSQNQFKSENKIARAASIQDLNNQLDIIVLTSNPPTQKDKSFLSKKITIFSEGSLGRKPSAILKMSDSTSCLGDS